jgi:hypothetical protein
MIGAWDLGAEKPVSEKTTYQDVGMSRDSGDLTRWAISS